MRYSVKAAAMATGVTESRLRTWERRYGIPRPGRSATGRRLYDEEDLAIIRRMAALVSAGISASEAAQVAQTEEAVPRVTEERPAEEHPLVEELVQASRDYDEPTTTRVVREAVRSLGYEQALETVLFPALRRIGEDWGSSVVSCSNEHFASEVVRRELYGSIALLAQDAADAPLVLLACPEDERHDLGLLALHLLLRSRRLPGIYLGADVPTSDLLYATQRIDPDAICLSATTTSGLASLGRTARTIVSSRMPTRLFIGGPAFGLGETEDAIPGIRLPYSIRAAADVIAETVRRPSG